MIKAITFDLDGVYFTADSFSKFKADLPKTCQDNNLVDYVFATSDETKKFRRGEISEEEFWSYARLTLGITISNQEIFQLLADSYNFDPKVADLVKNVRSMGYQTCICSNNFPTRTRTLEQKFHFLSDFDVKIFSFEVGVMKPDPIIYHALIKAAGCLPQEVIYSDDKINNVNAALSLGINAFEFQGFDHFIAQLQKSGLQM